MRLLLGIGNWVILLTRLIVTQTWCNDDELKELERILVHGSDRRVLGGDYEANLDKLKSMFFPSSPLDLVSLCL